MQRVTNKGRGVKNRKKIANILDGWSSTWISISAHSQLNLRNVFGYGQKWKTTIYYGALNKL